MCRGGSSRPLGDAACFQQRHPAVSSPSPPKCPHGERGLRRGVPGVFSNGGVTLPCGTVYVVPAVSDAYGARPPAPAPFHPSHDLGGRACSPRAHGGLQAGPRCRGWRGALRCEAGRVPLRCALRAQPWRVTPLRARGGRASLRAPDFSRAGCSQKWGPVFTIATDSQWSRCEESFASQLFSADPGVLEVSRGSRRSVTPSRGTWTLTSS